MNAIAYDIEGIKYYPYKMKIIDGVKYYLLVNVDDVKDFCIRKEITEEGKTFLSMLANDEEFNKVLNELEL